MPGLNRLSGWGAALLAMLTIAACGVPAQDHPVEVDVEVPSVQATAPPDGGDLSVNVYLVRGGRLVAVPRSAPDRSAPTVLALLTRGPLAGETAAGIQTALLPQALTVETVSGRTVTIAATQDFTSIFGDDQLLATAQLVWTVTEYDQVDRVRVTVDGEAIDVPTDDGLAGRAVGRTDYMSVAPGPAPGAPSPTPTGAGALP